MLLVIVVYLFLHVSCHTLLFVNFQYYIMFISSIIPLFSLNLFYRESLAFATEPVFSSLANLLGCHDNMPTPIPPDIKDHKLYEVEIKYGLLQVIIYRITILLIMKWSYKMFQNYNVQFL